jgi:hypothetical protein
MELCNAFEVTDRQPLIYEYCHKTVIVHDRNHINLTAPRASCGKLCAL